MYFCHNYNETDLIMETNDTNLNEQAGPEEHGFCLMETSMEIIDFILDFLPF